LRGHFVSMDIRKVFRKKPIAGIQTNDLGLLYVFPLTVGDRSKLLKSLSTGIKFCDPGEFVRKLFVFVCFPEKAVKKEEDGLKPESPVFSFQEISQLSIPEQESIAKAYVEGNEWLYKEKIAKQKIVDGREVMYQDFGEVLHPRKDDENYIDYLFRLHLIFEEEEQERFKKMVGPALSANLFTDDLRDKIRSTLLMGARLSENLDPFRSMIDHAVKAQISNDPIQMPRSLEIEKLRMLAEKRKDQPIEELGNKLDQVTESVARVAEFVVAANVTQTQIVSELKSSSDSADWFSRRNLFINVVIVIISTIALVVSFSNGNSEATWKSLAEIEKSVSSAEKLLKESSESLASQSASVEKCLNTFVANQSRIDKLTDMVNRQMTEILELQKKIEQLESANKK